LLLQQQIKEAATLLPTAPVGVFDSGIGGLSILRELRLQLPHERWVYLADAGYAPYGERDEIHVIERTLAVAEQLRRTHHTKALVVACNTATAAAIAHLRQIYPDWPIVGVEPALKPGVTLSRTGHIGVMATHRTLNSSKFQRLLNSLEGQARFSAQACNGLAKAIESQDTDEIDRLIRKYTNAMGRFGSHHGMIDTVVLGCTHYGLVNDVLVDLLGPAVQLIDPADGVARRLKHQLQQTNLLHPVNTYPSPISPVWLSTGSIESLHRAVSLVWPHQTNQPQTVTSIHQ
jgi:glutamate racemase